jgi:hypothetical protein
MYLEIEARVAVAAAAAAAVAAARNPRLRASCWRRGLKEDGEGETHRYITAGETGSVRG